MIELQALDADGFARFLERAIPRRAARQVARGVWTEAASIDASREVYRRAFPQGIETPGQHVCDIVRTDGAERVGEVWYSARPEGGRLQFWIEWIWVDPPFRRRGFARATLTLLEAEARRGGATRLGLTVWMDNPGALALYRSLGYATHSSSLVKELSPSTDPPG